ncbi:MAG: hypothetical protein NZ519_00760 [Bacteroidia bacterium]|nr:hypothetical protein [Bacteroidia bacterium]MDW8302809.1 hypothetical protein [Bacteroidia bacterium]
MKSTVVTVFIVVFYVLKAQIPYQTYTGPAITYQVTPIDKLNQMQVNKIRYDMNANLEEVICPDSGFNKDNCFVATYEASDRKKVQAKLQGYMAGFGLRQYYGDYARMRYKDVKIPKLKINEPVTIVFDLEDQGNGKVKVFVNFKFADGKQISSKTHPDISFEIRRWLLHSQGKYKEEKF